MRGKETLHNGGLADDAMKDPRVRRDVTGLGICIAVWLLASIVLFVVLHIDSNSWLVYPLGVLNIIPIPVALVFIFLLMKRALEMD